VLKVWAITVPELAVAPLTPDCETTQLKVVPLTLLVNAILVALPEQSACEDGVAVADGAGFTVTVEVTAVPAQPPAVGVTVYTAVPALVAVAVRVCAITVPDPAEAPVTFVCVTVQLKDVPVTLLVSARVVVLGEQIFCDVGVTVAEGMGLTVTVVVIGVPLHPPADGVIV
jgi:hypothetical protein